MKEFTAFVIEGTKVIATTPISGDLKIKLLDNNYSLVKWKGSVYALISVDAIENNVFIFVNSFPSPLIDLEWLY